MNVYNEKLVADNYNKFLNSKNGRLQQLFTSEAIIGCLNASANLSVLDAACGNGWLTESLSLSWNDVRGCDVSSELINQAKNNYPTINFTQANLEEHLPYSSAQFDAVILNMAATDIENLNSALTNLNFVTKPGGKLLVTIPNPYLAYPIGTWKRSLLGKLLFLKPKLKLKPYFSIPKGELVKSWGDKATSYFHRLPFYLNAAKNGGWILENIHEIKSQHDSARFNLQYQLHRYPLILLLEFKKP